MVSGFIEHVDSMIKVGSLKLDGIVGGLMDNNCVLEFLLSVCIYSSAGYYPNGWFQTRANRGRGRARVKFWSTVHIAYHYFVLRDDGAEPSDGKDNRPV